MFGWQGGSAIAARDHTISGSDPGIDVLRRLALARPDLAWRPGTDISLARNAHYTNTRAELAAGLQGEFDWVEGDIRLDVAERPVMQHDDQAEADLDLETWLSIVVPSGRGIKLDIKDRAALTHTIEAVRRAKVPEHRLIFNVYGLSSRELLLIRRAFPKAIINLSPVADAGLTFADIAQLQVAARVVGPPVMFPIRTDLLSPAAVMALRPYGRVAAWNSPNLTRPAPWTDERLRAMGVDGMLDLRPPSGVVQNLESTIVMAGAGLFGWDAVHRALDALDIL